MKPEEHFLTVLLVRSTDAGTITEALQSFLPQKQLDQRKLIGQGYDGAATFSGKVSWVHKRIQTSSAHAIYIHCCCHRLQLASIQAAASVMEIRMFFGTMTSIWKYFIVPPKKPRHWRASWLFLIFLRWRSWSLVTPGGCRMSVVLRQFSRNYLHCCKPFHVYTSHLEMLRLMVYTFFRLVLLVYLAVISCQKFSVPLLS